MTYLLLAISFSSLIIITFRLFTRFKIDNVQAITINYLVAGSLAFTMYKEPFYFAELPDRSWFSLSLISAFFFILVFYVFARSAQNAGVAITAVASKMSVVIPVSIGILLYGDLVNVYKISGILLCFPAFYLIFKKKQNLHEPKLKNRWVFLLPVLLFIGTGTNDSVMKHAQKFHIGEEFMLYLGVVFWVALLLGLLLLAFDWIRTRKKISMYALFGGCALGTFNFYSTYFFLKGLTVFESSVFFPIFNVSIVSIGALIGWILFKEKLSTLNWIGIFMAILTILLIAIS